MLSRTIRSHGGTQSLKDCLATLLSLETITPSPEIYLISPFLSNTPIIDNRLKQYSDIFPVVEDHSIYLSDIIQTLAWKKVKIRIICNPERKETKEFLKLLGSDVEIRELKNNHEKGLVTSNFYIHGSMNFTYSGININGEHVRVSFATSEINQALMSARARWEEADG